MLNSLSATLGAPDGLYTVHAWKQDSEWNIAVYRFNQCVRLEKLSNDGVSIMDRFEKECYVIAGKAKR